MGRFADTLSTMSRTGPLARSGIALMLTVLVGSSLLVLKFASMGARAAFAATTGRVYVQPAIGTSQRAPSGTLLVKPRKIAFNKYDYATRVRWRGWGGSTAKARGRGHVFLCTSSCAAGFYSIRNVSIRAYRIRLCNGRRQYTRLRWGYSGETVGSGANIHPRSEYGYVLCGSAEYP